MLLVSGPGALQRVARLDLGQESGIPGSVGLVDELLVAVEEPVGLGDGHHSARAVLPTGAGRPVPLGVPPRRAPLRPALAPAVASGHPQGDGDHEDHGERGETSARHGVAPVSWDVAGGGRQDGRVPDPGTPESASRQNASPVPRVQGINEN